MRDLTDTAAMLVEINALSHAVKIEMARMIGATTPEYFVTLAHFPYDVLRKLRDPAISQSYLDMMDKAAQETS